jgi:hypothetical protein
VTVIWRVDLVLSDLVVIIHGRLAAVVQGAKNVASSVSFRTQWAQLIGWPAGRAFKLAFKLAGLRKPLVHQCFNQSCTTQPMAMHQIQFICATGSESTKARLSIT